ncbi:MAG: glycine oxidase ThiO [Acidobacteriota bacterium]|nr:MAG: glycine oxidase ThiO [Acidobacteriota bacterium]
MRVIVLGAGIIGATIAEALAQRGADVAVLDMRGPNRGASQASAGMLTPYIEGEADSPLLNLCVRSLSLYDSFVARLLEVSRGGIEYARTGTLEIALDDDGVAKLLGNKVWLDTIGVESEWLDGNAVRSFEPSITPAAHGGLLTLDHGLVGVTSLMNALVHQARLAGATFEFPVEVHTVAQVGDRVEVTSVDRTWTGDAAVIAGGSWSRRVRIPGVPSLPVRPVRGQLLHLQWCEGDQPGRICWGPHCYAVPWSDGTVLVGATMEEVGFDEGTTVAGVNTLTSAAIELLPHATGARLDAIRVGLRPMLPDELPAIGPFAAAPRIVAATGHYRNGVLLAPLTAELVTGYLLDNVRDDLFEITTPDRFAKMEGGSA